MVQSMKEKQAAAVALAKKAIEDLDDSIRVCRKFGLVLTPKLIPPRPLDEDGPDQTVSVRIERPAEEY